MYKNMATSEGIKKLREMRNYHKSVYQDLYDRIYRKKDEMSVYQYTRMTSQILSDLNNSIDVFFGDERQKAYKTGGRFDYISEHGFFRVNKYSIITPNMMPVGSSRKCKYDVGYAEVLEDQNDSFRLHASNAYRFEDLYISTKHGNKMHEKICRVILDRITKENKFTLSNQTELPYRPNYYYIFNKNRLLSREVRHCVNEVICIDDLPEFVSNDDGYSYEYDVDEKKLSFTKKGRKVDMRIGKGIRKLLKLYKIEFTDEDIKNIVNRMDASTDDYELRVVEGEDITKYYNAENYERNMMIQTGSLSSSCMRYDSCASMFEAYEEHAKMLILVHPETDKIIGRALLWDTVNVTCGSVDGNIKFMDRIYSSEAVYIKFKDWATANGYHYKRYQSYSSPTAIVDLEGERDYYNMKLDFSFSDYDEVPFCDTFFRCDEHETSNVDGFGHYNIQETDGTLSGRDYESDEDEDEW